MQYLYPASLEPDPDGGYVVTFRDVPEAITHGMSREEALENAREALGLALRGYLADERPLPEPGPGGDHPRIAPYAADAAKLAVIAAFGEAGISKSELARRLGKGENEARRILDPDHPTKLAMLDAALIALGIQLVISVEPQPVDTSAAA